jgi:hypothetical protein
VDYPRCTHCRNPIKAHQRQVRHPLDESPYHDDCWVVAHATIQHDYVARIRAEGLDAIFSPYVVVRLGADPWLPEQRTDEPDPDVDAVDAEAPEVADALTLEGAATSQVAAG